MERKLLDGNADRQECARERPCPRDEGKERQERDGNQQRRDRRHRAAHRRTRAPRGRRLRGPAGKMPVVQYPEAEREGEVVEEAVVAGREHDDLESDHQRERDGTQPAWSPHEKRDAELDGEGNDARGAVRPHRELVHVPAHPRRQGRGLVVRRHGGEVAPRRIAQQQLREPRLDVETEEQPLHQEHAERMRRRRATQPPPAGRHEDREEGGLEEQVVPLERQEVLPDADIRQVERPARDQRPARHEPECEHDAERAARHRPPPQPSIGAVQPEHRQQRVRRHRTRRLQPALAIQQHHLPPQRPEGDHEDRSQHPKKNAADA